MVFGFSVSFVADGQHTVPNEGISYRDTAATSGAGEGGELPGTANAVPLHDFEFTEKHVGFSKHVSDVIIPRFLVHYYTYKYFWAILHS